MQKEIKPLKIKAAVQWAFLDQRNDMSGKYQVDLCDLSKAAVDALAAMGVEAQHKDEKGFYITCKSKNYPIEAQTTDGERLAPGTKVGNGSKVTAIVSAYPWTFKNKKGWSPSIKKLVITELIEYKGKEDVNDAVDVDDSGSMADLESDIL